MTDAAQGNGHGSSSLAHTGFDPAVKLIRP